MTPRGNHISLFAGVGMTDLAAEGFGFETVATAEIDPFNRSVLAARLPDAWHFNDVRQVRPEHFKGALAITRPLLVSGGFPCQDVSALGVGTGLDGSRSGLWTEFQRVIREFRPEYVLIENSPMLRSRGLWRVLDDLAVLGYDARWDCIPAASVGAPHLRDRIFVAATPTASRPGPAQFGPVSPYKLPRAGTMVGGHVKEGTPSAPTSQAKRNAPKPLWPTPRKAPNEWRTTRNAPSHGKTHGKTLAGEVNDRERAAGRTPAVSSESAGNVNPEWVEWLMGLPAGWTDPGVSNKRLVPHGGWASEPACVPRTLADAPHRRARLGALGNGLVPQAAAVALGWVL